MPSKNSKKHAKPRLEDGVLADGKKAVAIHWAKAVDGDFSNASNWKGGKVPGSKDNAALDAAGSNAYTVTASTSQTVAGIQTAATATLAVTGGVFTTLGGSGTGLNAGAVEVFDAATFALSKTLNNTGLVGLNSGGNATTLLIGASGATLSGKGSVVLDDSTANMIVGATVKAILTNQDNTISGAGSLGGGKMTLVNQTAGLIDANLTNVLTLNTGTTTITNAGTLESTGAGGMLIQSAVANSGTIDGAGSGALTLQNAKVSGTGGMVEALAGGHLSLQSATITGGAVSVAAGGLLSVDSGGSTTASSVTATTFTNKGLVSIDDNASLTLQGSVINSGTLSLVSLGNSVALIVGSGGLTLSGKGQVILDDSTANSIGAGTAAATLTNIDNTISGAGLLGSANLTIVNGKAGVIDANDTNVLIINTGANTIANAGLIEATGGGGLTLVNATVANTATGIILAGAGATITLQNDRIIGGSLKSAGNGSFRAGDTLSVLDGSTAAGAVTLQGPLDIGDNTAVTIQGAIANSGAISLASGGNTTSLIVGAGNATLTGTGQILLDDSTANRIVGASAGATLTNIASQIIGAGQIGAGQLTLINQKAGIIEQNGTNTLTVNTGTATIVNAGLMAAGGQGGMIIQSAMANSGTLAALGTGALTLQNAAVNQSVSGQVIALAGGHISLQAGTVTGGAVNVFGGAQLTVDQGGSTAASTLAATTIINQGAIIVEDGATLTAQGTVANSGVITVAGAGVGAALIVGSGNLTLTAGGSVTLGDSPNSSLTGINSAARLVNVDNTISGSGSLGRGKLTIVNQAKGVIAATGSNTLTLDTAGKTLVNGGLIEAVGAGGLAIVATTIDDTGGGLLQVGDGSRISLASTIVLGGRLVASGAGTGLIATADRGSVLDGSKAQVSLATVLDIVDATALTLKGAISNTGAIVLQSGGALTDLIIGANTSLTGSGQIDLGDSPNNRIYGVSANTALTNVNNVISGAGQLGNGSLSLINQVAGIIDGSGANALVIDTGAGTLTNAGLIEATGAGGVNLVSSTLNNGAGGMLTAGANSQVGLQSATIAGGILTTIGSGIFQTLDDFNLLDGSTFAVNIQGAIRINDNTALTLKGAIVNAGSILIDGQGDTTSLIVSAIGATLTGKGTITLSANGGAALDGVSSTATLTNVDDTIDGAGQLGAGALTLINQAAGIIDADGPAAMILNTSGATVTNNGLIEATGAGGLTIQNTVVDGSGGGMIVAGSTVSLQSAIIHGGSITGGVFQTVDGGSVLDGGVSAIQNTAVVQVDDNTALTLVGSILNKTSIALQSGGNVTSLIIGAAGATLSGGGHVLLSDNTGNTVMGQTAAATLTNLDNTIEGAGSLGGGQMTLINAASGIISNSGANLLTIKAGDGAISNAGVIDTIGSGDGGISIEGNITNTGALDALGSGVLALQGGIVMNGVAGVIHAGDGSSVALYGVTVSGGTLSSSGSGVIHIAGNFDDSALDGATNTVVNLGVLSIDDLSGLSIEGAISNVGTISSTLFSQFSLGGNTTLSGGGEVYLGGEVLTGNASLINSDNTIVGSGSIGGGSDTMTLINLSKGVIDGTDPLGLQVGTGSAVVTNSGLIEATTGRIDVESALDNTGGIIEANGGKVSLLDAVNNTGAVLIKSSVLEMEAANETANVGFTGTTGTLELDNSQTYSGKVSGFSKKGGTLFDLLDISYAVGTTTATFSGNNSGGTLTVTDGTHTTHIALVGNYTTSQFIVASDGGNGTLVHDPAVPGENDVPALQPPTPATTIHAFIQAAASLDQRPGAISAGHGEFSEPRPILLAGRTGQCC